MRQRQKEGGLHWINEWYKFIAEFKHRVKDDCFLLREQYAVSCGFLGRNLPCNILTKKVVNYPVSFGKRTRRKVHEINREKLCWL